MKITDLIVGKEYSCFVEGRIVKLNSIKGKLEDKEFNGNAILKLAKIDFSGTPVFKFVRASESKRISELGKEDNGKQYAFDVLVESVTETSGPIVFKLNDGSGFIYAKSFSPGKRAFSDIKTGDIIRAKLFIRVYDNKKEAEFLGYDDLNQERKEEVSRNIDEEKDKRSIPKNQEFIIKSECYDAMKETFLKAATLIRRAIIDSRKIIIRHHADCDGYCGGIALERAILPLIIEEHKNETTASYYYRRSPSKTPFYEYADATKDLSYSLEWIEKYEEKPPLIILADFGSSEEDLLAIKKLKIYDAQVIVIDHHQPFLHEEECPVKKIVEVHLNPHLFNFNESITAGMLCSELSRFINENASNIELLPALSGLGDKVKGREIEEYLKIASNRIDLEFLKKVAKCIDFEAYYLGFVESRSLIDDLLGSNIEKQKKLVELLMQDIERREKEQLKIIQDLKEEKEVNGFRIFMLNLDEISLRAEFPPPGKITGMAYDFFSERGKLMDVIVLGIGSDYITIRTSLEKFNTVRAIEHLKKKISSGFISGGGHKMAGTIKFVKAVREKILEELIDYLKNL
ncbi:MAG: DHH family phosphoesterase [Candidatus Woesearchaeota archaeon]